MTSMNDWFVHDERDATIRGLREELRQAKREIAYLQAMVDNKDKIITELAKFQPPAPLVLQMSPEMREAVEKYWADQLKGISANNGDK